MKLRTRLTTAIVVVTSAGTLLLGGVAISEVRSSKLVAVDHSLEAVTSQVTASKSDQIAAGLFAAEQSPIAVAVGFVAKGSDFTWLRELPDASIPVPDDTIRAAAVERPVSTAEGFRMYAVHLKNGETLLVASSISDIGQQTVGDMVSLATFWVILSLAMGLLIRRLVRRDVNEIERLVDAASEIAAGAQTVEIPDRASSTEVSTLAQALHGMVASLRATLEVQQATNQRMQEFLGDASHELRTPLTVIKGYLELLERDVEPEQRDRALRRMRAESLRMEGLINDLLLLAEIGTAIREAATSVDVTGLVRVSVDDLKELQPARRITSSIEGGLYVHAVPSHLHRAIGNAFANIRRHTPDDAPVHVSLVHEDGTAVLVVEDGGPGLPAETYARGMAHFQRFDKSRARATGGSGLGMSIIAAVMQELGGSVVMSPSSLGGLCLTYRFPLAG